MSIFALAYLILMAGAGTDPPRDPARVDAKPAGRAELAKADKDDESGASGPRAPVCHKGRKTLELPQPAVHAHVGHGDQLGPCAVQKAIDEVAAPEVGKAGT